MDFGIIFCAQCGSSLVDSGFESGSTLRCCKCGNTGEFKVGKVSIDSEIVNVNFLIEKAKQDAGILLGNSR
ncbi:hypothetical protein [Moorella sp. Hama-1]|uniref:hypothetical protein n=1 Tax=Moorella sp. Hama-1 TaxID=2138101 RepID=UPI0012907789|nr:hypothetical protein [Moorella sp. Hama-1]BCV20783.1 hypothetical protein hamaS1_08520 [Moorella sp. Hama-1]